MPRRHLLALLILILLPVFIYANGWHTYFSLQNIQAHQETFQQWNTMHPVLVPVGFSLLYAAVVALSLPVATVLTLLGGFLFGRWWGTLVVVCAATLGAVVIFLVARSSVGESLRKKAGPRFEKIAANLRKNATGTLLFLRLVPLFPFFLVNIAPALVGVRLRTYVWTTFIGILPGTFVYVNLGGTLGEIDSLSGLVSWEVLAAFVLLGLFALLPNMVQTLRKRKNADAQHPQ